MERFVAHPVSGNGHRQGAIPDIVPRVPQILLHTSWRQLTRITTIPAAPVPKEPFTTTHGNEVLPPCNSAAQASTRPAPRPRSPGANHGPTEEHAGVPRRAAGSIRRRPTRERPARAMAHPPETLAPTRHSPPLSQPLRHRWTLRPSTRRSPHSWRIGVPQKQFNDHKAYQPPWWYNGVS